MTAPNDKRSLPYGGSFAIQDPFIIQFIKKQNLADNLWKDNICKDFCHQYVNWIRLTENNKIIGLENFTHAVYSDGTSEAFRMFYIKNKDKRFRCYAGEYVVHQLAWRNNWTNWKLIKDNDIEKNDAVVISLPFADTGNEHQELDKLLMLCTELNVPVLMDCAYFGTTSEVIYNFDYPCITDITFSLSKTFPVAHARIGLRLTKVDDDDLMLVHEKINYNNRLSAGLGLDIISNFSADYIYNKYRSKQLELCNQLKLAPSKCVLFGLDYNNRYPEYNRGGMVNRLGLHKHYV